MFKLAEKETTATVTFMVKFRPPIETSACRISECAMNSSNERRIVCNLRIVMGCLSEDGVPVFLSLVKPLFPGALGPCHGKLEHNYCMILYV